MRPLTVVIPSLAALVLGSCAMDGMGGTSVASDSPAAQCFRSTSVTGFSDAGSDTVIVNVGNVQSWELKVSPGCPHVDYAMRVGIVSRGRTRICAGNDAELLVPRASGSGFERCLVRSVRRMSDEEAAASRGRTLR